jgi:hypothetical protein
MEGLSNILLLGFPITITKKEKETISNAYFSLPIPRKRDQNPSFTKKITIQDQDNKLPRGVPYLAPSIHQEISPKDIFTREKHHISQE